MTRKIELYCTTYCNQAHRLSDGKPVAHECYILPPQALQLERAGDFEGAIRVMQDNPREVHRGVRYGKH